MKEEIKEILDILKNCKDYDDEVFLIKQHSATLLLDYITNLQQENERLKQEQEYNNYCDEQLRKKISNLEYKITTLEDYKSRCEKASDKIQYIIDYGFDYDGFNTVESLKGLIDMLVEYAIEAKDILKGDKE